MLDLIPRKQLLLGTWKESERSVYDIDRGRFVVAWLGISLRAKCHTQPKLCQIGPQRG